MAFTKKIWGFVAASVVTVPGIIAERPQKGENAALEEDQGKVTNNRVANVCCLKSFQTPLKKFSAEESDFNYPSTYNTKYTFYEGQIEAKMMDDENFDPDKCDMTALVAKVGKAESKNVCLAKMESLPVYWKTIGEWEDQNRQLLGQDAAAHLQFTIGEQQKVVKANNAEHMKTFDKDKAESLKSISEDIKSQKVNYFDIIEAMKKKLTELQSGIDARMEEVQKAAALELDEAQASVYPAMDQRLNYLTGVSQSFNLEAEKAPEQPQEYPPHEKSAFEVTNFLDTTTAYDDIHKKVQEIMDKLIKESQLENIQSGVEALKPRVLGGVKAFLTRSDASLNDQEEKVNKEKVKWVNTVETAKTMIAEKEKTIALVSTKQEAMQRAMNALEEGSSIATSREKSNCAFPDGQDKLNVMDYCCCKMKPEGEPNAIWSWVPKKFEDWTSCEETKKMTKDAGNYALQAVTLGYADTGSCNYFSLCASCSSLDAEGKVLFDPKKKRAASQMYQHADLLEKYGLEFSKAAKDNLHFYARCPGSATELKISLDVRECNGDEPCMKNAEAGFLVPDSCCAVGTTCLSSIFSSNSRCAYLKPLRPGMCSES